MIIKKENCCSVTGHRKLGGDFDERKLKKVFKKLIETGYDTFMIGMAVGFDTACFNILEKFRDAEYKNIKLIACIPCKGQDYKFSEKQKAEYNRMIESADERIYVSENYTPYCMFKRNAFMVDNSVILVAYLSAGINGGGTFNTVSYARKKSVPVINIAEL